MPLDVAQLDLDAGPATRLAPAPEPSPGPLDRTLDTRG
jgi:hypothetical protein